MLSTLRELFSLLTPKQRRQWMRLQLLVVIKAAAEMIFVAGVWPFMTVVADPEQLHGDGILAQVYSYTGVQTTEGFLFFLGLALISVMIVSAVFQIITKWRIVLFAKRLGAQMADRLFQHYIFQPWLFHSTGSSSHLIKQIKTEVQRVTKKIMLPLLKLNTELVLAFIMISGLVVLNPWVAIIGLLLYILLYSLIYKVVRKRLVRNGKAISKYNQERFKLLNESLAGIKDVLLLGRQHNFAYRFSRANRKLENAEGSTLLIGELPRYLIQVTGFGSILVLILVLLRMYEGNLTTVLPLLSVYAVAFARLKPTFQTIYKNITDFKSNQQAVYALRADLLASYERAVEIENSKKELENNREQISVIRDIQLKDISFSYPNKTDAALQECSLQIPVHGVVGLVGSSGAGKSTAIDILLGLIPPDSGQLLVDNTPITPDNVRLWQNGLGFVPQSIFLSDDSIRRNIAFGLSDEQIDNQRVERAVSMAHLEELVAQLPKGLDTTVGERGVQLSGGQRQRIGIARALYDDAETLILDEATSALDGITEKLIMDAIHDFAGKKTIILIAHRLATVRRCDTIFLMEDGAVVDQGTYDELVARNTTFQRMAEHT